jgi:two-component system cell cycle sensor histidine kinase/response regulator CckA
MTHIIHWVAVTVAVAVAITLPAVFSRPLVQYLVGDLQRDAVFIAAAVSELVNASPERWQFQAHHLERALAGDRTRRIFWMDGRLASQNSVTLAKPNLGRRAPVFDAGLPIAYVEVEDTIRPILMQTGAVALLGLGLGLGVFVLLRVLPLRALQRSEEQFRLLAQSAPDGIVLVDGAGRIAAWNAGARTIFGLSEDEAVGRRATELFADFDRARYRELLSEGVRGAGVPGSGYPSVELTGRRRDGAEVPLEVALATWRRGAAVGHTHVIRDISQRRQIEEALRRSEDRLREAQRMEAIGRLAGGVAHDFNSRVTVIIGRAELLLGSSGLSDSARRNIEIIRDTARHVATLTKQLLAVGRRQILQSTPLDLNALVVRVTPMLRSMVGDAIELEVVESSGVWLIHADPAQLERVVSNLARNAGDAMPSGGRLRLETANVEAVAADGSAEPNAAPPGDCVMLRVQDTGVGMDPQILVRIFEPFFTTREFGTGAGLGLAVVEGIVKQHNGTIRVRSAPGQGATFDLYFPRAPMIAEQGAPRSTPDTGQSSTPETGQ